MFHSSSIVSFWIVSLATVARAQSVNLDFEPLGSGPGTATSIYGGPALYPGTWNSIHSLPATNLLSVTGAPTSVSVTTDANAFMTFFTGNVAVPPDSALVDDGMRADLGGYEVTISGLANGSYGVFPVCVENFNIFATRIEVVGAFEGPSYCGGAWAGAYVSGSASQFDTQGNYVPFTKAVTDGTIRIRYLVSGFVDQPTVNGIQVVKLEPITSSCFGDSGSLVCPCGNLGLAGRGCGNSANAAGALLTSSGTQVSDTLALTATGLPTTATALFVQSQTLATPTPFGDGGSCIGANPRRMFVKLAVGGSVTVPSPGDPSIRTRSALTGDTILPGSTRHYQVVYRDSEFSFCPGPQGAAFNATNALSVTW